MERLAILLVLFVVLVVLILARRQARHERAEAPAPVAMPAAAAALADATGTRGPHGAGGRDPYARLGSCPSCGRPMVERVGKRGALKGKPYLVCSGDPPCATVPAEG